MKRSKLVYLTEYEFSKLTHIPGYKVSRMIWHGELNVIETKTGNLIVVSLEWHDNIYD